MESHSGLKSGATISTGPTACMLRIKGVRKIKKLPPKHQDSKYHQTQIVHLVKFGVLVYWWQKNVYD